MSHQGSDNTGAQQRTPWTERAGDALIGRVQWQPPRWYTGWRSSIKSHPMHWLSGFYVLVIALLWWTTRPPEVIPPDAITIKLTAPARTDYTKTPPTLSPLRLRFSGSTAPIESIGKAPEGVTLTPAQPGAWEWTDDHTLVFTPAKDWPVGTDYTVDIDPGKAIAKGVALAKKAFAFSSPAFELKLASAEFYQDPEDPNLKKAVYALEASHPIDAASLEKRVSFTYTDGAGRVMTSPGKTFVYDERHLKAWVHSSPLTLPVNGGKLKLEIDKGVASTLGGESTIKPLDTEVKLPSLYSVNVDAITPTLVENDRYEPEQVLVVAFNKAMRDSDVSRAVHAWLLPADKPGTPPKQRNGRYRWSGSEVGEAVLKQSQPVTLYPTPAEREFTETHGFKYSAPPNRYLYVRVDKALKSFGGFLLGKPATTVEQVPPYPELLRFLGEGSLLSLRGERRVSIAARNVTGLRMEISRVLPGVLHQLVQNNEGDYSQPDFYGLSEDSLVERQETRLQFANTDPAKTHYEGIDLGKYLIDGKRGVFLLSLHKLEPYDAAKPASQTLAEDAGEQTDHRLVVLTDLGVLVKQALDGSRDVFVQSISAGTPVAGARVRAIARNGETLVSVVTDASGLASLPTLKDFRREKQPVMLTVEQGEDLSFLPMDGRGRTLDYSRFDVGGEPNEIEAGALKASMFSDRGLYRPGDTMHLGLIVRATDWSRPLQGLPLELVLTDPRGSVARRQRLTLGEVGFESFDYTPSESAPSGTWEAQLYLIGKDDERTNIGGTSVQVREFQPDSMRVEARLSQQVGEGWVKPDGLSALISAENLFGTPAQNRRVEASLVLRPAFPEFPSWKGWSFYDPQRAKDGYDEQLSDAKTDIDGKASIPLHLDKYARATYQLNVLVRTFEPGSGRNVAASASTLVSSNDYLVGIKRGDALDYVPRGSKRAVELVAIGPDAKARAVSGLHAVIIERRYVSVLTKQDSGLYKYVSQLRLDDRSDKSLSLPAGAGNYALPTDKPGDWRLEIRDAKGEALNRIDYSVAGKANLTRSLDRNAELQLSLSRPGYAPGDDIAISIRAPYAGSGLITIERDKVYAHVWFKADTTSSVQHITLPADFEGNGYVNVQFVRDPDSDDVFMSPLSYGVVPFTVDRERRTQPLSLDVPKVSKPGTDIPLTIHTQGKARVIAFAVDEGILQVARYRVGNPLDTFFAKKMLQVDTAQILDLILPEFSRLAGMDAPGGDAGADLSKNLNPFKRKAEKPAVWWSGPVEVDGERTLHFTLPDYFNGRVRIVVVAVTPNRIGLAETSALLRGDFVLTPTVPTHVAPGDEFELPIGVANTIDGGGDAAIPVKVSMSVPTSLSVVGDQAATLQLASGREGTARLRLRAGKHLGAAAVTLVAQSGKYKATRRIELSIRPATPARQQLEVGSTAKTRDFTKLRKMYNQRATRRLAASASPFVAVDGLAAFLHDYPHLCTEQIVSAAMPDLINASHPEFALLPKAAPSKAGTSAIDTLRTRQNSDGGFGTWLATPDVDPFVSAYGALYLVEARERGQRVPQDTLDAANRWLRSVAADRSLTELWQLRARAMAVYLLVRQGSNAGNLLAGLRQQLQRDYPKTWQDDDVTALFVASSYRLLQQDAPARTLATAALDHANAAVNPKLSGSKPDDFEHYYDAGIEQAWTVYLLHKHFPEMGKRLSSRAIDRLLQPLRDNTYNTLSSALTLLALEAYGNTNSGTQPPTLQAYGADKRMRPIGEIEGMLRRASFAATDARLRVTPASGTTAWYSLTQSGFDLGVMPAVQDQGLEVFRDYLDDNGKPVTIATLGQELTVRLRVRALGAKVRGNIAIIDLLPGGFETVMQTPAQDSPDDEDQGDRGSEPAASTLALPGSTFVPEHVEPREDRVLLYGNVYGDVREYRYRIRAGNVGTFAVPPIRADAMYVRSVYAQGTSGETLTVRPHGKATP